MKKVITGTGGTATTRTWNSWELERIEDILDGAEDVWQEDPDNDCTSYKKVRVWRTSGVSK